MDPNKSLPHSVKTSRDVSPHSESSESDIDDLFNGRTTFRQSTVNDVLRTAPASPTLPGDNHDECHISLFASNTSSDTEPFKGYYLRPSRPDDAVFASTWVDQDLSGNYNPENDSYRSCKRQRSANSGRRREQDISRKESQHAEGQKLLQACRSRNHIGCHGVATFRVRSESMVRLLSSFKDNWPVEACGIPVHVNSSSEECIQGSRSSRRGIDNRNMERPNLTGHPGARGCWTCANMNERCSMIADFPEWPCKTCEAEDEECELVTAPLRKLACEYCRGRRLSCSYTCTVDHSQPCSACQEAGFRCIAGPAKDGIPVRISYDRDWINNPMPKRSRYEMPILPASHQCARCRVSGTHCSFSVSGRSSGKCVMCDVKGFSCGDDVDDEEPQASGGAQRRTHTSGSRKMMKAKDTANIGRKRKLEKKRPRTVQPENDQEPAETNLPKPKRTKIAKTLNSRRSKASQTDDEEGSSSPGNKIRTITTKLSHPITFSFEEATVETTCTFCTSVLHQNIGLGPRQIGIIDPGAPLPITEVCAMYPPTQICGICTLNRISLLICPSHELTPINQDLNALDFEASFSRLHNNKPLESDIWCTLCPSLAVYECTHPDETGKVGCGLVLCEPCAMNLSNDYEGDMTKLLRFEGDEESTARPFGLRADVEVLRPDGPLARFIMAGLE